MPTFTPEMMKLLDQQVHNDVAASVSLPAFVMPTVSALDLLT